MRNHDFFYMIISIFSCTVYSQNTAVITANKNYVSYSYVDPLKTYERVIEKGYKSTDMLKKLANAHYFNDELIKAAKWYQELFALAKSTDLEPEYYFRYAQCLKSINKNDEANEMMKLFNQKTTVNTASNN
ncbi:tetratricopeptide repeat protein [Flavobacterium seoulense]|uniref:Cell envelope biogenesis protein OmpA n=1 Tax=Flavobacterium seoulense TaxID=1492738 RepID=A0A066WIH0_9FLAO|nr:flagellar motor protein MotB [Flavobacterium seoulense]KDN53802.1 cell envelope biogenesis protein OmpA [Flavobacterium seoulense]